MSPEPDVRTNIAGSTQESQPILPVMPATNILRHTAPENVIPVPEERANLVENDKRGQPYHSKHYGVRDNTNNTNKSSNDTRSGKERGNNNSGKKSTHTSQARRRETQT